jgi:hypothetical protein
MYKYKYKYLFGTNRNVKEILKRGPEIFSFPEIDCYQEDQHQETIEAQ